VNLVGRELRGIKLIRLLGTGGMGMVYLGRVVRPRRELLAGKEVAVKILHAHLVRDPVIRARFKREAGLGMTLRHPGIVRILHVGSQRVGDESVVFLVMEYLSGVTLRSVLEQSGTLSDSMVRQTALQLARALTVIHNRGIVHRDIKPENIFVTKGGKVKIGDFGLSQLAHRTAYSEQSGFIGSVAYAAPERFGPGRAESPSDLYSLGVVLYEMAVGTNPFLADDLTSTITNHLELNPLPPEDAGALVSPFLSHLIMALLDKQPQKRLGPTGRLVRILRRGEQSSWLKSTLPGPPARLLSRRRTHFNTQRKAGFYGRYNEVKDLLRILNGVRAGTGGRVAILRGEAGVGKTRLLDRIFEKMDRSGEEGKLILVPGLRSEGRVPYAALIRVVLAALDLAQEEPRLLRQRLDERMHDLFPERQEAAAAFVDILASIQSEEVRSVLSPESIAHLFNDFFSVLSAREMIILVVEDAQATDPLTRSVLLEIARHIENTRILMVLTVCTGEFTSSEEQHPDRFEDFLQRIQVEGRARMLELTRLDRKGICRILEDLGFPRDVSHGELGKRVHEVTEGNPYFVHEVARLLINEGVLNEEDPDWGELLRYIPGSIQDVFYRRLFKLSPEERRFLDLASIFGIRFRVDDVLDVLEMDFTQAARTVHRLRSTFFLIRPTVGDMHRFDHILIREMIYNNLDDEVRRLYHRRIGLHYEKLSTKRCLSGRESLRASVHFALGNDFEGALRYFFPASDYLLLKGAYESALSLALQAGSYARRLESMGYTLERDLACRIDLRQARLAGHLGRRTVEFQALKRASSLAAHNPELRALVSLRLAQHYLATSRFFSAMTCVQAALDQTRRMQDPGGQAQALQTLADVARNLDDSSQSAAIGYLDEALAIRRRMADKAGEARILTDMGKIHLEQGDTAAAEKVLRESLAIFRTIEDKEGIALILQGLGRLHWARNRLDLAHTALQRAATISHGLGKSLLKGRILADLGEVFVETGDLTQAVRLLAEARHLAEDVKTKKLLTRVLAAQARVDVHDGNPAADLQRGLKRAQKSVALAREAQLPERCLINALNALALVFLRQGKMHSARAISGKTRRLLMNTPHGTRLERETLRLHQTARDGATRSSFATSGSGKRSGTLR